MDEFKPSVFQRPIFRWSMLAVAGFAAAFGFGALLCILVNGAMTAEWVGSLLAGIGLPFAVIGFFASQEQQVREYRAYLSIEDLAITTNDHRTFVLRVTVRNYGRTPCVADFKGGMQLFNCDTASDRQIVMERSYKIHNGTKEVLVAGVTFPIEQFPISDGMRADCHIEVHYTDVFGWDHVERDNRTLSFPERQGLFAV